MALSNEQLYEKVLGLVREGKTVADIFGICHMYFRIAQEFEEEFIDKAKAQVERENLQNEFIEWLKDNEEDEGKL